MSHTKNHPDSPNGQDDLSKNDSGNRGFADVLDARLARRSLFKGGIGLAATGFMGMGLTACGGSDSIVSGPVDTSFKLGFTAVAKNLNDVVTLPTGYTSTVLYRLGDPINSATPAYANDGTDTAASFDFRAGDHHDGMAYFGLNSAGTDKDLNNSTRGLLVMNHENITQIFLHTSGEVGIGFSNTARVVSQIDKEVNAHGVSVIDVLRTSGNVSVNKLSGFNRRITAATVMDLSGPASGPASLSPLLQTKYSPTGVQTRGTVNNCANGTTPWGTYLTCEENWAGYFKRPASANLATKEQVAQNRYMGSGSSNGTYGWANPVNGDASGTDLYYRWDITPGSGVPAADYRNAANTFGWNVEIDPFAPASIPRKRTAMGRFGHEGAMLGKVTAGKPIVYYMGDDSEGEYMYKYVSTLNWTAADASGGLTAGDKYLDSGKLYVATYNDNGSGTWTELNIGTPAIATGYTAYSYNYSFANQADVLVNCRLAADAVGATPMDRPEWADVHPTTGDVYLTLTKNTNRGKAGTFTSGKSKPLNAPNPRYYADAKGSATTTGNVNGHIIRMKEAGSDPAALTFSWDIYLFGAQSDADSTNINISGLTADNDFSSPDGLWFSHAVPGLMWIQTDDGSYTDVTNCMMLAAMPGQYGDGGAAISVVNRAVPTNSGDDQTVTTFAGKDATSSTLKRFLVGPKGCEITGIAETPDGKAIFVNIQHPGESTLSGNIGTPANFESHWPGTDNNARPRSSTIVITKDGGGLIGS